MLEPIAMTNNVIIDIKGPYMFKQMLSSQTIKGGLASSLSLIDGNSNLAIFIWGRVWVYKYIIIFIIYQQIHWLEIESKQKG